MFYADLHVHSKFSRATSRDCDLEHLTCWAARKGITVVATGDFTHPAWLAEICGVGPQSKTVRERYDELLRRVGPELFILADAPTEQIARAGAPLVAEAIGRMR